MQKNVKQLSKISLILVFLIMFSCVKDDFNEKGSPTGSFNGVSVKHYRGNEAQTLGSQFQRGILSSTKISIQPQGVNYRTKIEVNAVFDEIIEVKDTLGNTNYTFRVEGIPDQDENIIYNMVINVKDDIERAYLVKHHMSEEFANDYHSGKLPLEQFKGILSVRGLTGSNSSTPCDDEIVMPVNPGTGGGSGGGGSGGYAGVGNNGSGSTPGHGYVYIISYDSATPSPGTGDCDATVEFIEACKQNPGLIWYEDICMCYPSVRYFRVGNFPVLSDTPDPCDDGTIGTIGILPNKNHERNCEELSKMSLDSVIMSKIQDLQGKVDENREYGYAFSKGVPTTSEELDLSPNQDYYLKLKSGGLIYGIAHIHGDPTFVDDISGERPFMPMFSLADIFALGVVAAKYNGNNSGELINYSMFFLSLTVMGGENGPTTTYVLKIDNWDNFRLNFLNKYKGLTSGDKKTKNGNLERKYLKTKNSGGGGDNYLRDLFKFLEDDKILKNSGFSIYESDNQNLTGWKKKTYDKNEKKIIETPCN